MLLLWKIWHLMVEKISLPTTSGMFPVDLRAAHNDTYLPQIHLQL